MVFRHAPSLGRGRVINSNNNNINNIRFDICTLCSLEGVNTNRKKKKSLLYRTDKRCILKKFFDCKHRGSYTMYTKKRMISKYMINIQETHDIELPIFSVWLLFNSVSCQSFGTMRLDSRSCSEITLTVNVDPKSSTFSFNWFLRVNGSTTNVSKSMSVLRKTFACNFVKEACAFV